MKARIAALLVIALVLSLPAFAGQDNARDIVQIEAGYIARCQFLNDPLDPAYGCINNTFGVPSWVVPRQNAMAILGLLMAADILQDSAYADKARLAADYLVRVQDADGAWFNRYYFSRPGADPAAEADPEALAKPPSQTAEVMIALSKLGYDQKYARAMRKGARYLIACQTSGGNGFLIGGGKDAEGFFRNWRWASDNACAYQALKAAELWALAEGDHRFALICSSASRRIIRGIDMYLYIQEKDDPDQGVWRRVIDENDLPVHPEYHDWINYAPQMLDLPCRGTGEQRVGEWINRQLQNAAGACVWDDQDMQTRQSPGYSFQAVICWLDLGQEVYAQKALNWAVNSGLWTSSISCDAAVGGWVDWKDSLTYDSAPCRQRFIETSFYAIAAYNKGYAFSPLPGWLRVSYQKPSASSRKPEFCLQFQFPE